MKPCPACHRIVPDDTAVCPHTGCGIRLLPTMSGPTKKRPPPPGAVSLTDADVPASRATGVILGKRPASGDLRRAPVGTLALLALLFLLVAGIFYAAMAHKVEPARAVAVAATSSNVKSGADRGGRRVVRGEAVEATRDPIAPAAVNNSPAVANDDHEAPAKVEKVGDTLAEARPAEPLGLYAQRTRADREDWIGSVGGSTESELGVADGLDWLARHQAEDGHWGPDCLEKDGSRCEKEHPCGGPGGKYEAALTGLAVLAFQAGGHYDFNGRPYSENVRRGLEWLIAVQAANGEIVGSLNPHPAIPGDRAYYEERYMYEHAIATFALAEACAVARAAQRHADEKHLAAAIKAVRFIEAQQHDDGGWRYRPFKSDRSDTSISGWAMLALKTAKEADIKVNPSTISKMTAFFEQMADPLTGRTRYIGSQYVSDATTGVGMMVDEFINHQPDSKRIHLASAYLADQAEARWSVKGDGEGGDGLHDGALYKPDFYLWYNCTLAMFLAGGDPWDRWNNVVRNHVLSLQIHGSDCARGSWDPEGQWARDGGRVFSTALAVLTLEVYYRFSRDIQRPE
jgi:hypothetical protein